VRARKASGGMGKSLKHEWRWPVCGTTPYTGKGLQVVSAGRLGLGAALLIRPVEIVHIAQRQHAGLVKIQAERPGGRLSSRPARLVRRVVRGCTLRQEIATCCSWRHAYT
jgi:hypothetical protein